MINKFNEGDRVKVVSYPKDYRLTSTAGMSFKVIEVIKRSKDWTQYEIEKDDGYWEIADEQDLEASDE